MSDELRDNPDYARIFDALCAVKDLPVGLLDAGVIKEGETSEDMLIAFGSLDVVHRCVVEHQQAVEEQSSDNRTPGIGEMSIRLQLEGIDEKLHPEHAAKLQAQLEQAQRRTDEIERDVAFDRNERFQKELAEKIDTTLFYIKDDEKNPMPKESRPELAKRLIGLIDAMSNIGFNYDSEKYATLKVFANASRGGDSIGGMGGQ